MNDPQSIPITTTVPPAPTRAAADCPGCYTGRDLRDGQRVYMCYRWWWLTTCECRRCVKRRVTEGAA